MQIGWFTDVPPEGQVNINDLIIVMRSTSTSCIVLNNMANIYIYFKKYTALYVIPRQIRMLAYSRHHLSIARSNCRRQYN